MESLGVVGSVEVVIISRMLPSGALTAAPASGRATVARAGRRADSCINEHRGRRLASKLNRRTAGRGPRGAKNRQTGLWY